MTNQNVEGYRVSAVEQWIAANISALKPPFKWTRFAGGHSNITYKLEGANGKKAVIRRPPKGELLPKAHDMGREWSLISSLGSTSVPVPNAIGICRDPEITGASFYIMELIDGRPLYTANDTLGWVPEDRRAILAHSLFDVLADLHSLEPDEIGLGDLAKKDSYVARQLKTWYRSWNACVEPAQYDDPRAHQLQQYFLANIPEQGMARVVHGDYGLHNCLIGADSTVVAVVDWEISTLGDPLADLAYALNPWPEPDDPVLIDPQSATSVPGMPTRSELAQRYAQRTGRSLDKLNYYTGFNRWKSAAIIHGVYARYMAGQKTSEGVDLDLLRQRIEDCLSGAESAINRQ
ncbi:MAG: aminoglycoside phosphotransferase (APT) family kinase protein [Cryomorphaceae bacterium]|jgi:aminoglycoside phosphotransferase (APT) family kinase protein